MQQTRVDYYYFERGGGGGLGNFQQIYSYTAKSSEKYSWQGAMATKIEQVLSTIIILIFDVEKKKSSISYYPPKSYTTWKCENNLLPQKLSQLRCHA